MNVSITISDEELASLLATQDVPSRTTARRTLKAISDRLLATVMAKATAPYVIVHDEQDKATGDYIDMEEGILECPHCHKFDGFTEYSSCEGIHLISAKVERSGENDDIEVIIMAGYSDSYTDFTGEGEFQCNYCGGVVRFPEPYDDIVYS